MCTHSPGHFCFGVIKKRPYCYDRHSGFSKKWQKGYLISVNTIIKVKLSVSLDRRMYRRAYISSVIVIRLAGVRLPAVSMIVFIIASNGTRGVLRGISL